MEEEKTIKELNDKGFFKIKKVGVNEVEIVNRQGTIIIEYSSPVYLELINTFLEKQVYKYKPEMPEIGRNHQIVADLNFEFFYSTPMTEWSNICDTVAEVISSEKNPYRAVLRLVKSVGNKYVLTNIDRNRRLWK